MNPNRLPVVPSIGDLWPLANDPEIARLWHQTINATAAEMFAPEAAERDARLRVLTTEIADLRAEQRRRAQEHERAVESDPKEAVTT